MSSKKNILTQITRNKNFSIKIRKPFDEYVIDFISDFSNEIRRSSKKNNYDLMYLSLWCSRKKINELKKDYYFSQIRLGRGLIFHICPSNVPTNFIYSFFFGLLSGNSNIVKIPSNTFHEKDLILKVINNLFKDRKYLNLKNSNFFINLEREDEKIDQISSICDGRLIWGGDKTINEIRKKWIPERAIEMTFSDRYSISVIDIKKLKKLKILRKQKIIRNFFYDTYIMNQLACNSPHFVFWIGKIDKKLINSFWEDLYHFSIKHYDLREKIMVNKYTKMIKNIIDYKKFGNIKRYDNNLYVIDIKKNISNIENLRGFAGTFFQLNLSKLDQLKTYVSKKCQTATYYGVTKKDFEKFILENEVEGIDRIVPIGNSFDINQLWDGYDIISNLTRLVNYE
jgi:methyl coenzyme M reductase subunit D